MKKFFVFVFLLAWFFQITAQDRDSVIWLNEVLINEQADINRGLGYQVQRLAAQELQVLEGTSFTQLLSQKIPGGIRAYGISGLTTANLRGTGSSHTAVLWNGISLESPSNGSTDLSQITSGLLDNVVIQFGGSSGTFGSGAIGGTLHLNNSADLDSGYQFSTSLLAGSFGRTYQRYKAEYATGKHVWGLSLFDEHADNNFTFKNTARRGEPEEEWEHAAIDRQGLLASYYFQSNPTQVKILWWRQNNLLEIPNPATVSDPGQATQEDISNRMLFSWDRSQKRGTLKFKSALIANRLIYENPAIQQESETDFHSLHNELQNNTSLTFLDLNGSVSHRYEWVTSTGFSGGETANRHRMSAHLGVQKNLTGLFKFTLDLRQERVGNDWVPTIPSLVLVKAIQKRLVFNAHVSRVYRVPTFNDLFWNGPGGEGNPDLKSERGWTWEVGSDWALIPNQDKLNISLSVFSSHIDDWILWAPITASIWSPENIKQVWSRGAQVQIQSTFHENERLTLQIHGNYQYTQSTNEDINAFGNAQELARQLIYTPIHQGGITFTTEWSQLTVSLQTNFIGEQFTTGDNNPFLAIDSYLLTNMRISYQGAFKKLSGSLRLELNNLLDQNYFARAGYPMPGLHFNLGLNLKLSQHATNF